MLARAEAKAAETEVRVASMRRGVAPPTPDEMYGHMPSLLRGPFTKITSWTVNAEIHTKVAEHLHCQRNAKLEVVTIALAAETYISFARWCDLIAKLKNHKQWEARGLALEMPRGSVIATRSPAESIRLIVIKFITLLRSVM